MKVYISKATLRTIEKFGNASLTHISATPSDHMSVELDATPLANEASKPACAHRIVDARNEIVKSGYLCVDCGAVFAGIHAPAAPSVEQDERGALIRAFDASLSGVPRYVIDRFGVEHVADGGGWIKESDLFDRFAASTSANVAQGAEAVALTEDQRQILEWCKNYHFRRCTEGDFHLRIVAVVNQILAAPPAQTATTDDARDAARWRWFTQNYGALNLHEKFAGNTPRVFTHGLKGRSWGEITRTIDAALTAAQSASGDTK